MPSPFPGMDPYLEAPDIWPDFHDGLCAEMRAALNQDLPPPFYARLEMRPELGIVVEGGRQRIVPEISVVRRPPNRTATPVAVLEVPPLSPSFEIAVPSEPIRHQFIEVRDPSRGRELVTLIELLSPSNKRPGPDQRTYRRKQDELLSSDVNLIEIDLLRTGDRLRPWPELELWLEQREPPVSYVVWINRVWSRERFEVFPVALRETLPRFPAPLRQGQAEVPLDLQAAFQRAYDNGPYRRGAVDYEKPPVPPLSDHDTAWVSEALAARAY